MEGGAAEVSGPDRNRRFWTDIFLGLAAALALGIVLKTLVLGAVYVPSASMEGTILSGDYVLVDKLGRSSEFLMPGLVPGGYSWMLCTPSFRRTQRGDIVLFRPPDGVVPVQYSGERFFVKRCIATGGDTVEFRREGVVVNGRVLQFPPTATLWKDPERAFVNDEGKRVGVPEGCLFLLGDNPFKSSDSRVWGCIPEYNVVGRAAFVYWSKRQEGEDGGTSTIVRWERIGTVLR